MNSKQRVMRAVCHKTTDRIPVTFDAEKEVYHALYRKLNVPTKEQLFNRLGVDTWMILPKNFIYPESEIGKEIKTSIWGYKTQYQKVCGGGYDELCHSPLSGKDEIDDIKKHKWPGENAQGYDHFPDEALHHGDRAVLGVFTWGAYFLAAHIRGIQDLMLDFVIRPEYVHHLFGTIADISSGYLETMLSRYGTGIDIVYMADDYCFQQAPFFSPAAFKMFVVPYLSRYVDLVHQYSKKFLLHVCGAVRPLLPMIVDCGVDMLEPIQTRATGMDPEGLKRDFGQDICFYGGMDLQHILRLGTKKDVEEEAKRLIDILGKDGGYIFGPGHTYIQVDAPLENIMTMYETAAYYYPHKKRREG
jgi:uroporphyrinogen decarboxylase